MANLVLGYVAGLFVCFTLAAVVGAVLTGDSYLAALAGFGGMGYFIYSRATTKKEPEA